MPFQLKYPRKINQNDISKLRVYLLQHNGTDGIN